MRYYIELSDIKVQKNLGSDKAVKELRQEIDKLKQANQELTSHLAKVID